MIGSERGGGNPGPEARAHPGPHLHPPSWPLGRDSSPQPIAGQLHAGAQHSHLTCLVLRAPLPGSGGWGPASWGPSILRASVW